MTITKTKVRSLYIKDVNQFIEDCANKGKQYWIRGYAYNSITCDQLVLVEYEV